MRATSLPLALFALLLGAAPAAAGTSPSPLEQAVDAVGGEAALGGLRSFSYRSSGEVFVFNEGPAPGSPPGRAAQFTATVRHRIAPTEAVRLDLVRNSRGTPRQVREVVNGRRGSIDGQYGNFGAPAAGLAMTSDRQAALLREQRLLNPHLLLRAARSARSGGAATLGGRPHRIVTLTDAVAPIRLYIDRRSGRITRLTTTEHDYVRRDVAVKVTYGGWRSAGRGVLFPRTVTMTVDGFTMHRETRTALRANPSLAASVFAVSGTAIPYDRALARRGERTSRWLQSFAHLGFPKDGSYATISAKGVAPGIVLLDGVSNSSLVIVRDSGVVVLEGSVHDLRADAVINYVQKTFPGKPITHIVSHHHHVDHNGGVRQYVGLGARAVVHEAAAGYFRAVFAERNSRILPDRLDTSTAPAQIDVVPANGQLDLPDATRPVTVFPEPTGHATDTAMTYVPDAEVLFVNGDTYSPGGPPGEGGRALEAQIQARGLKVSWITGAHGRTVSYDEFKAALGG